jgi:hypothetical protein
MEQKEPSGIEVQFVEPKIQIESFTEKFMDDNIYFQLYIMNNSFYLWIGLNPPQLKNLSVAVKLPQENAPSVSSLFGEKLSPAGSVIAQRLSKKTGKMFFVSYNMPKDVQIMQEFVERKITDRLKPHLLNSDQTSK